MFEINSKKINDLVLGKIQCTRQELDFLIKNNENVENVDVSKIENFSMLFMGNKKFNQDLSNWDTSSATYMSYMFFNFTFNNKINFNTINVKNMEYMFARTTRFNQSLGDNFDIRNVENMENMFKNSIFNQSLGDKFFTFNVDDMRNMFYSSPFTGLSGENFYVDSGVKIEKMFLYSEHYIETYLDNDDLTMPEKIFLFKEKVKNTKFHVKDTKKIANEIKNKLKELNNIEENSKKLELLKEIGTNYFNKENYLYSYDINFDYLIRNFMK
jgi:surface protein